VSDRCLTDGVVTLRPSTPDDVPLIIAGRDAAFRRFIGEGSVNPNPEFCILVGGSVVGWVDHDHDDDRWWLAPEEVNIGYHVFPPHRGRRYATRAVRLMFAHLRDDTDYGVATLLIHPDNAPSIAIAERNGFERTDDVDGRTFWRRRLTEDCQFFTERLALRPMRAEDLDLLVELNSDGEVMEFITGRASTVEETTDELEGSVGTRWLVFEREGMDFVGWVGAVPSPAGEEYDVAWRFQRDAWGRGFATEAAQELIDRLFANGAQRVFAQTMAVNTRSRAVMERLGLRLGRTFLLHFEDPLPGTELGEVEYEVLRFEWDARHR
jgi:RimJ/RimL family protein N-acetyltransferase